MRPASNCSDGSTTSEWTCVNLGSGGTTAEKVRIRCGEHTLLRLDRGATERCDRCAGRDGAPRARRSGCRAGVRLRPRDHGPRRRPRRTRAADRPRGRVGSASSRSATRPRAARLVTPNQSEAATMSGLPFAADVRGVTEQAQLLARRWEAGGVVVTLGARGALLVQGEAPPLMVPATVERGDPCGAGDCFAASLAGALADGALPSEAVAARRRVRRRRTSPLAVCARSTTIRRPMLPRGVGATLDGRRGQGGRRHRGGRRRLLRPAPHRPPAACSSRPAAR